jgi:6-phospho-beta-glucosidase
MGVAGKLTVLGGGSARTPLLIHGIAEAQQRIGIGEVALYDIDRARVQVIAALGGEVVRRLGGELKITTPESVDEALAGSQYVISSLRVGGSAARARDEAVAREYGFAGQETTGPGGMAMALRTIPVALEYARAVDRCCPEAWLINFTNPAGLITQALTSNTKLRVVGICDTPTEVFHKIAEVLHEAKDQVVCHYAGLNHLGWVSSVKVRGQERIDEILNDDSALERIYPPDLFSPELIRSLGALPTEYLFFYYSQRRAFQNQCGAGATRGEEVEKLDSQVFGEVWSAIAAGDVAGALHRHAAYLIQRSASYLRLEGRGESAFGVLGPDFPDPFQAETGYHRMALEVIGALASRDSTRIVVNVPNGSSIPELEKDDVVEIPCQISAGGVKPVEVGPLPSSFRGLVLSVKQYERLVIGAVTEQSADLAQAALLALPIVGQWEPAQELVRALIKSDPQHLGYLERNRRLCTR